jgi:ABC-type Fe3+-hydroxamate transport system substrate-binding protein
LNADHILDDLGRRVPLDPPPSRILSLVPSVTELLFDLGAGPLTVGRTEYCISPGQACSLPSVGGPKTIRLERVGELRPDLVLANAEENRREQVEELIARGYRVHVAFPRTLRQAAAFLRALGRLLRLEAEVEAASRELEEALSGASGPSLRCACLVWKDPYIGASGDTLVSAVLEAAGAENVLAGAGERYPRVTTFELAGARPEVLLLPSEPYPFGPEDAAELAELLPEARSLLIPGEWVTWYGSRMAAAVRSLREVLDAYRRPG